MTEATGAMSVHDFATATGQSAAGVRRGIHSGRIPGGFRAGNRLRVNQGVAPFPPGVYTVDQCAARLAVPQKSVRKWIQAGRMPGVVRIGRCVRIDKATLEKRILSGEVLLPTSPRYHRESR